MKSIAIIGFGRFGELLASLAKSRFEVSIVEPDDKKTQAAKKSGYNVIDIDAIATVEYIFLAVPISAFEETVRSITPYVQRSQVVIDLCSVKTYPVQIMKKYLASVQLLGSHPMFGPDSASRGLDGLQIALCPISITDDNLADIRAFWADMGVTVLETTPEQHDQDTAYSQAFTYSIAKVINGAHIPAITFKTRSFTAIHEVAVLSARDTEQLFHDMLFYNPYFSDMKKKLEKSFDDTLKTLNAIEREQQDSKPFDV